MIRKLQSVMSCSRKYDILQNAPNTLNIWQMRTLLLIPIYLFTSFLTLFAQQNTIVGTIKDDTGKGIEMVSIAEKGTTNGTRTDANGKFSITVTKKNATLLISSVGFKAQEIKIENKTSFDISMVSSNDELSEVVVVGYTTKTKESLTGAISTVTSKDIERVHGGSTVSAALAGKIAGVTFRMPDGRPGAGANIQIRNMGTPLFVIDGIQQDQGQFNNLAQNDIESITILKDASAEIYGVRFTRRNLFIPSISW